ncbi:MAG: MaoC family dehydratase [Alphaproteobacteria bacterium]|nr:MaoC family dehydratase [Alphaproteobacteria bacterium]
MAPGRESGESATAPVAAEAAEARAGAAPPAAEYSYTVSPEMVAAFADATGDCNPLHFDAAFAATTRFGRPIAHGMLTLGLVSTSLWRHFGNGVIYLGQDSRFVRPVFVGDTVTVRIAPRPAVGGRTITDIACASGGRPVLVGHATIMLDLPPAAGPGVAA